MTDDFSTTPTNPGEQLKDQLHVDPTAVDELQNNIETALKLHADEYGVQVREEAVELVQSYILGTIPAAADRGKDAEKWFWRLHEEMLDPTSQPARTNISVAIGSLSRDNADLRRLAGAIMKRKYSRDDD